MHVFLIPIWEISEISLLCLCFSLSKTKTIQILLLFQCFLYSKQKNIEKVMLFQCVSSWKAKHMQKVMSLRFLRLKSKTHTKRNEISKISEIWGLAGKYSQPPELRNAHQASNFRNLRYLIFFVFVFDFNLRNLRNLITFCIFFEIPS